LIFFGMEKQRTALPEDEQSAPKERYQAEKK
jgi:hypothetical protein